MNICLITDNSGAKPVPTCVKSIMINNPNAHIYIICENKEYIHNLLKNSIKKIENITLIEPSAEIIEEVILFTKSQDNFSPDRKYLNSIWNFIRFYIEKILPEYVKKCIYIDTDTIVNRDISEVYNSVPDNYEIAACYKKNLPIKNWYYDIELHRMFLTKHKSLCLFNAGVYILNLELIKKTFNVKELLELKQKYSKQMMGGTQVLCNLAYKSYYSIDEKMNSTGFGWMCRFDINSDIYKNAYIYHYTGGLKPWLKNGLNKNQMNYLKHDLWLKYNMMDI
jgi:lipopolysaccharide biosynthesis glycosyltransferase